MLGFDCQLFQLPPRALIRATVAGHALSLYLG